MAKRPPSDFNIPKTTHEQRHISKLEQSSPWPNEEISFHWTFKDYPYPHIHEYYEMEVLVSGTLLHELNGQTTTFHRHYACLLRPDDCHSLVSASAEPVVILNFMVKKEYMDQLLATFGKTITENILHSEDLSFVVSESLLNECITNTQSLILDPDLSLEKKIDRCRVLFISLLSELIRQNIPYVTPKPKWLSDLLLQLSQADLSKSTVATDIITQSNYSYSRLSRLFKKYMGCTISQYVSYLRIEQAKEYLKNDNMRIIDIANAVGFDNVTYFNRVFKAAIGQTPSEFRKKRAKYFNRQDFDGVIQVKTNKD